MFANLNPGTVGLGKAAFRTLVAAAPRYEFEGIDFPTKNVRSVAEARELRRLIEDVGLRWGLFSLPCDFLRVDDERFEQGLAELETMLPWVEAAGCERAYNHVWPGSNERDWEENYAWHVERLARLNGRLLDAGVRLGIEFIGPKTLQDTFRFPFIRSASAAAALADSVGAGLGIVVDCFHWYTSGETLDQLREALAGRRVVNVHVNDATAGRSRDEQLDLERRMPLETGLVDAPGILRLLDKWGYEGPVIAEPFNPHRARFAELPVEDVLAEVGSRLATLFFAAGVDG